MKLLTREQWNSQARRLAAQILLTEEDSEPHDPECEIIIDPEVWQVLVALARQVETSKRGPDVAGICRVCGCTLAIGCMPRCSWTDESMTLCSECAKREERRG